ncbi:MAG: RTX toxin [Streptococcaceae bacterium]|jgi:hypothetical protein|nr:RTX toxin [Streptococcaceae bacterium]
MKIKRKYLLSMILLGSFALFSIQANKAEASVLTGSIDTDGSKTGLAGATYYTVTNGATGWEDMQDTYQATTPDATSNNTVYFFVNTEVLGSPRASTESWNSGKGKITEGKSLYINANNQTLHVDNDTNDATSQGYAPATAYGPFYIYNTAISANTTLTIENANIINNISGGIFKVIGQNALATSVYKNVTTTNGAPRTGAQPIINNMGKIVFQGKNTFNILIDHDLQTENDAYNWYSDDNRGEWIQGGNNVEVQDGETVVNYNWGDDQPLYSQGSGPDATLSVFDNASLIWNMNSAYTSYWGDGHAFNVNWNIGKNGQFIINGTKNTFAGGGQWFMSSVYNQFNMNIAEGGKFYSTTAGGYMNIGDFRNPVIWNVGQDSELLLNNKSNSVLISGNPVVGSSINLNNPKTVTFNTYGGSVFNSNILNFPINITGDGLRTHTSSVNADFKGGFDLEAPNEDYLNSADIWYRQNIGTITRFGRTDMSNNLTPNPYSSADMLKMYSAKYISWFQPRGTKVYGLKSDMSRSFNINLGNLPLDGTFSTSLPGLGQQKLVARDDRGQAPSFNLTVSMMNNYLPEQVQYIWIDPVSSQETILNQDEAVQIASVTSDNNLPSYIVSAGAGMQYTMTFPENKGLNIQAKNSLKLQNNVKAGTFKYSINNGPGI